MNKKLEKDYSISVVRLTAFVFVVVCHMMQYMECRLAWCLNVGVQMFLCISGFLYGKKEIHDHILFYIKQMKKILVPYYVVILPVILLYWCFATEKISILTTIKMLLCYGTVCGGGHLWYIATILMCYFLIPIWSDIFGGGSRSSRKLQE